MDLENSMELVLAELRGLRTDMDDVKSDISVLKTDVADLKTDVVALKTDVADLKTDVVALKTDVADLKTDVVTLKTDVADLKTDVAVLKTDVVDIKSDLEVVNSRLDRLEQGQADILEQQREHTVLIHALMDGQVTLEERIADFRKECNQKITVLAERVYECEQVICRNSYDIALLKMAK